MQTRKYSEFGHISRSVLYEKRALTERNSFCKKLCYVSSCNEDGLSVCKLDVYELYIFQPILLSRKTLTKCVTLVPTVSLSCKRTDSTG